MDIFLARQPILDVKNNIFGYELLYRDGKQNFYLTNDGNYASSSVLTSCFIDFGIEEITNNKKAFINFTEDLLFTNVALLFPNQYLVIEILENIDITPKLIEQCKHLKEKGYSLALDDVIYTKNYEKIIDIVDIVKVDFLTSSTYEKAAFIDRYKRDGLVFLAEKVETLEDYEFAKKLGYSLFQGYYFSKPSINSKKKLSPFKESHLNLIQYLNSNSHDFNELAKIIESDPSFSYEILYLVNSAYFNIKTKITSIKHAIVTLGLEELKKWIYLVIVKDLQHDKPSELATQCMLRAKFMENIATKADKPNLSPEMMTIGMLSMADSLTNTTMQELLNETNFSDDITSVLLNKTTNSFASRSLKIVLNYEKGDWNTIVDIASSIGLPISILNIAYLEAVAWVNKIEV